MTDPSTDTAPGRPPSIHVRDLEQCRPLLTQLYGDVTLDVPGGGSPFEWRVHRIDLGPVALLSGSVTTDLLMRGAPSGYTLSLGVGHQGRAASSRDETQIAPGRSAAVFSPASRFEFSGEGPLHTTTLRIDRRYLESQFEALTGVVLHAPLDFALSMTTSSGPGAALERLCLFLAAEARRSDPSSIHPLAKASLGEAVARALLLGQPHDHSHLLERKAPLSSRSVVRHVEEYLEAHAAEPITMTDLTALVGASAASIDAAFRAHRSTTAMAFLRRRRLVLAREHLLRPGAATVAEVARASGFLRRERFDAAYGAEFRETPTETKRRGLLAVEAPPVRARPPAAAAPLNEATVFVVDGDGALLEATADRLRRARHVVRTLASSRELFAAVRSEQAGCVVFHLRPSESGSGAIVSTLRKAGCALPLIFTSDDGSVAEAVEAMKSGAVDFLVAPVDGASLLAAVERGLAIDAEARAERSSRDALVARIAALSPREHQVCEAVARGMLNKQIAAELGISEGTVRVRRAAVMEKLGVGSAAELSSLLARVGHGPADRGRA